jgi:hypothetical protein
MIMGAAAGVAVGAIGGALLANALGMSFLSLVVSSPLHVHFSFPSFQA